MEEIVGAVFDNVYSAPTESPSRRILIACIGNIFVTTQDCSSPAATRSFW